MNVRQASGRQLVRPIGTCTRRTKTSRGKLVLDTSSDVEATTLPSQPAEVDPERSPSCIDSARRSVLTTFIARSDHGSNGDPGLLSTFVPAIFTSGSNFNSEMTIPQTYLARASIPRIWWNCPPAPWLLQRRARLLHAARRKLVYDEARRW